MGGSDQELFTEGQTYDGAVNMLKHMTMASSTAPEGWIYVYTADEERLWSYRVGGGGSLWSLRDLAGQVIRQFEAHTSWSTTRDYVHRDGQLFATVLPTGAIQHDHLDHLGTPRLLADANKAAVANFTYFPFGEEVAGGTVSAERMRFTGHERDLNNAGGAGDDLDYMHARFCSPVTGRFLSVDAGGRDPHRPQSWNRFSYTFSNPLLYLDRDGKDAALAIAAPIIVAAAFIYAIHHVHRMNTDPKYRESVLGSLAMESRRTGRQMPTDLEGVPPAELKERLRDAVGKARADIIRALKALGERNKQKGRGGKREPKKPQQDESSNQKSFGANASAEQITTIYLGDALGLSFSDLELLVDAGAFSLLDEERALACGVGVAACPF